MSRLLWMASDIQTQNEDARLGIHQLLPSTQCRASVRNSACNLCSLSDALAWQRRKICGCTCRRHGKAMTRRKCGTNATRAHHLTMCFVIAGLCRESIFRFSKSARTLRPIIKGRKQSPYWGVSKPDCKPSGGGWREISVIKSPGRSEYRFRVFQDKSGRWKPNAESDDRASRETYSTDSSLR